MCDDVHTHLMASARRPTAPRVVGGVAGERPRMSGVSVGLSWLHKFAWFVAAAAGMVAAAASRPCFSMKPRTKALLVYRCRNTGWEWLGELSNVLSGDRSFRGLMRDESLRRTSI